MDRPPTSDTASTAYDEAAQDEAVVRDDNTAQDMDVDDPLLESQLQAFQAAQKSRLTRLLLALWHGPSEPSDEPPARLKPLAALERYAERFQRVQAPVRHGLLAAYLVVWFLCVYSVLGPYFTTPPGPDVISLGCTDQLWRGKNAKCGLDGVQCVPGRDGPGLDLGLGLGLDEVVVRCPALCDRSWTYSLEPIGDQRIKYRGYFVGGGLPSRPLGRDGGTAGPRNGPGLGNRARDGASGPISRARDGPDPDGSGLSRPYRADSYVCGAAVHAGILSPFTGGCVRLSYASGPQHGFDSVPGHYGVDDSIAFPSFFPASFYFKKLTGQGAGLDGKPGRDGPAEGPALRQCHDPRLLVLTTNILLGIPVVVFTTGLVVFWTITTVGFWTIALATDPPVKVDSTDLESYATLLSIGLERFLPACFILYALWRCSTARTLSIPAQDVAKVSYLSRLFYFYPPFWLGVLNNISFDRLPVDRLTVLDLKTQPGGAIAVAGIVLLVVTCAVIQAYKIWAAGKFRRYLVIYTSFVVGLVVISSLPGLTLRVHHYILAMLLIPGCCTRGVTALMFQGILLGLFLSGAARWGLAAIAETDTSLRRNDPSGKLMPPELLGFDVTTGLLSWADPDNSTTSVSVLINDIERWVGTGTALDLPQLFQNSTQLGLAITEALKSKFVSAEKNIPLYIRVGKKVGERYSDFTNAGVLQWPGGEMELPGPGIT